MIRIGIRIALPLLLTLAMVCPPALAGSDMGNMQGQPGAQGSLTAFRLPAAYAGLVGAPRQASLPPNIHPTGLRLGTFQGYAAWLVQTPYSTAAISVFGGQLLSFVPRGGQDVLWLSPLTKQPPTPIRGGTPVCWPYFGKMGQVHDMPSHGLVRTLPWHVLAAQRKADGSMVLNMAPPALADLPLRLTMTLHIGHALTQTLVTTNVGDQPVVFTQALHNYFHVGDVSRVSVSGLSGLTYLDKNDHGRPHRQHGDWRLAPQGFSDRIYTHTTGNYVLHDPVFARNIHISTQGSHSAVVWNAGEQAARNIEDIGAGWRHYLSVETANVAPNAITLQPGQRHQLTQVIKVVLH